MEEENQLQQEPQQVTTKEPQQVTQRVTTKDPKKVEAGRCLAAHNRKKRELKVQRGGVNQYYSIGAVIAVGVIGGLGYYIYRTKKGGPQGPASGEVNTIPNNPPKQPSWDVHQSNKFEM